MNLKNYRTISLLSVACKVFTKIILANSIRKTVHFNEMNSQCFVKATRGEYNQSVYIVFIDYKMAFNSVEISAALEALRNKGVYKQYVKTMENIYSGYTTIISIVAAIIINVTKPTAGQRHFPYFSS